MADTIHVLPEQDEKVSLSTGFAQNTLRGDKNSVQMSTIQYDTQSQKYFDPASSTIQDLTSVVDDRKMRQHRENEVRKLHNRIQMLQDEEDKALRRIDETRKKA